MAEVAGEYQDNTAGYLSQPIAFPASVLNRIASFLPLKDVRNLGACCTSAFVLCCDHIDRLTVRVPKTKRLHPLFRGFAKYANVTRVKVPHRSAPPMSNLASVLVTSERLQEVVLCGNGIGSVGVSQVSNAMALSGDTLRTLQFGENVIGDKGGKALAKLVRLCSGLEKLGLEYNLLKHEGLSAVINAAKSCPSLSHLSMSHNTLTDVGATALAAALPSWPKLTFLGVASNGITCTGASELARALGAGSSPALAHLHLDGNGVAFGEIGARVVCQALQSGRLTTLQDLRLGDNGVGPAGANMLFQAAGACPRLALLDVKCNGRFAAMGTQEIHSLLSATRSLRLLDISQCRIDPNGLAVVAKSLPTCSTLRVLIMNGNNLGHHGSIALAEGLPRCGLTVLRASDCGIGTYGMGYLGAGIARSRLCALDISCNELGNAGTRYFTDALQAHAVANTSLTSLNISANKVVVGVGATERTSVLSPLFHLLPNLTALNVSGNVVGDDGLRALGHSLLQATQLLSLNVNGTSIATQGVLALTELLPGIQSLRELSITANRLADIDLTRLRKVRRFCPALRIL